MNTVFHDSAGITITEVIVAVGVVSVGLLALIAVVPYGTSAIGESNLKTTATFLAQQRLERVKNAQWTAAPPVDALGGAGSNGTSAVAEWPDEDYHSIAVTAGNTTTSYPGFRRQVRIADCWAVSCTGLPTGTNPSKDIRRVTVTVFFRFFTGPGTLSTQEENVQVVTLLARRAVP